MKMRYFYRKFYELIIQNQFILYLLLFIIVLFTFLWLQSSPTFLDPDSFYHLKMSKMVLENRGPVINFPYLQYTILKNYYIDHHFLYHALAIPFILTLGDLLGFKFYTVILSTAFIIWSYIFLRKYKIIYAELFTLLLLTAPALLFRISLAKATAFSLLFLFVGIYCIFKKKYWYLFFISFFYVWSYGGFLLILATAILYIIAKSLDILIKEAQHFKFKKKLAIFFKNVFLLENFKLIMATFSGIVLGLIINPYFPKNLFFYWQQIVQIGIINYRGTVNVGGEWYPYSILDLLPDSGAIIIFAAIAIILFVLFYKKQKTESIFFLLATLVFFILTLKSKRYVEYFIPCLVYFSAFSLTYSLDNINLWQYLKQFKFNDLRIAKLIFATFIYLLIIVPIIMVKDVYVARQTFKGGISFTRFAGIAKYLADNTKAGEIIMHSSWDDFPMLFYYNNRDYYIVGLDPTFMYKFDPNLYNLYADITMAKITTDIYSQVKTNFNATYFIVNQGREQLERNLILDGNFSKVYEDSDGKIFKLK